MYRRGGSSILRARRQAPTPLTLVNPQQLKDLALSQITSETQGAKDTSASTSAEDAYDPLSIMSIAHLTDTHVAETVRAVAESSIVQDAWKAGKKLSVHGWVYHVSLRARAESYLIRRTSQRSFPP